MIRKHIFSLILLSLALGACTPPSKITYLQDTQYGQDYPIPPPPELHIQKNDRIQIEVLSTEPDLAEPFNIGSLVEEGVGVITPATYTVDSSGHIDFPVFGRILVEGLTMKEIQEMISNRIIKEGYIRQPIVKVSLTNFTITVLKYGSTSTVKVDEPSLNILQVVAPAEMEKIKEVQVFRTVNGVQQVYPVNFLTRELFNSPVFYLQQNDIVYVKPKGIRQSPTVQTLLMIIQQPFTIISAISGILVLRTLITNDSK